MHTMHHHHRRARAEAWAEAGAHRDDADAGANANRRTMRVRRETMTIPVAKEAAAGAGASSPSRLDVTSSDLPSPVDQLLRPIPPCLRIVDPHRAGAAQIDAFAVLYNPVTVAPLLAVGSIGLVLLARALLKRGQPYALHNNLLTALLLLVLLAGIFDLPQSVGSTSIRALGTLASLCRAIATGSLWFAWLAAMLARRKHPGAVPGARSVPSRLAMYRHQQGLHTVPLPTHAAAMQMPLPFLVPVSPFSPSPHAQRHASTAGLPAAHRGLGSAPSNIKAAARSVQRRLHRDAVTLLAVAAVLVAALDFAAHAALPLRGGANSMGDVAAMNAALLAPSIALERAAASLAALVALFFARRFVRHARWFWRRAARTRMRATNRRCRTTAAAEGQLALSRPPPHRAAKLDQLGAGDAGADAVEPVQREEMAEAQPPPPMAAAAEDSYAPLYFVGRDDCGDVGAVPSPAHARQGNRRRQQQSSGSGGIGLGFAYARTLPPLPAPRLHAAAPKPTSSPLRHVFSFSFSFSTSPSSAFGTSSTLSRRPKELDVRERECIQRHGACEEKEPGPPERPSAQRAGADDARSLAALHMRLLACALALLAIALAFALALAGIAMPFVADVAAGRVWLALQLALACAASASSARAAALLPCPHCACCPGLLRCDGEGGDDDNDDDSGCDAAADADASLYFFVPPRGIEAYSVRRLSGTRADTDVDARSDRGRSIAVHGHAAVPHAVVDLRNANDRRARDMGMGSRNYRQGSSSDGHVVVLENVRLPPQKQLQLPPRFYVRSLPPPPLPSKGEKNEPSCSPAATTAAADAGAKHKDSNLPHQHQHQGDGATADMYRLSPYWQSVWITGPSDIDSVLPAAAPDPNAGDATWRRPTFFSFSMDLYGRDIPLDAAGAAARVGARNVGRNDAGVPLRHSMPALQLHSQGDAGRIDHATAALASLLSPSHNDRGSHGNVSLFPRLVLPSSPISPMLLSPPTPAALLLDRPENARLSADVPCDESQAASPGGRGAVRKRTPNLVRSPSPLASALDINVDDVGTTTTTAGQRRSSRLSAASAENAVIKNAVVETLKCANTISVVGSNGSLSRKSSRKRQSPVKADAQQTQHLNGVERSSVPFPRAGTPSPLSPATGTTDTSFRGSGSGFGCAHGLGSGGIGAQHAEQAKHKKSDMNPNVLNQLGNHLIAPGETRSSSAMSAAQELTRNASIRTLTSLLSRNSSSSRRASSIGTVQEEDGKRIVHSLAARASIIRRFPTPPDAAAAGADAVAVATPACALQRPDVTRLDLPAARHSFTAIHDATFDAAEVGQGEDDDDDQTPTAQCHAPFADPLSTVDDDEPVLPGIPSLVVRGPSIVSRDVRAQHTQSVQSQTSHISVTSFVARLAQGSGANPRSSVAVSEAAMESSRPDTPITSPVISKKAPGGAPEDSGLRPVSLPPHSHPAASEGRRSIASSSRSALSSCNSFATAVTNMSPRSSCSDVSHRFFRADGTKAAHSP
ncbi:hypothetical protein K437DRAFT_255904 [Tilletiaria anomala UBC 951]|uniref:Uncharacterized protein n=1 Tax=Tilletiaria anomala (strain ATCC 24038 / CBS 436.72 / UBC 951) TaxID=1037660 RepID=A0A066W4B5_TILAU|nr:uncharacterized protein K437DRAFT_255904 [Tilletiaria anomala UBC 951]KDN47358.1 hypothetical protein K437DRAFT_255904 [Tilletiaria anomala UBC 951]